MLDLPLNEHDRQRFGGNLPGTKDRFGLDGAATAFRGQQFIDLRVAESRKPTGPFTVTVWACFGGPEPTGEWSNFVWHWGGAAPDNYVHFGIRRPNEGAGAGRLFWVWDHAWRDGRGGGFCLADEPLIPRRWYYLTATFDGERHRLFVDGEFQKDVIRGGLPRFGDPMALGASVKHEPKYFFHGGLDDFKLHGRAWSREEVRQAYLRERVMRGEYLVVDLSAGPDAKRYPVDRLKDGPPDDLLSNGDGPDGKKQYQTTHLVLRRIPAGTFLMGSPAGEVGRGDRAEETQHQVTISQDFLVGVFEVTHAQYAQVMGASPATFRAPENPVVALSWNDVRGAPWPENRPAPDSFLGRLAARTGLAVDFPTEAQWEYACRAGATTALNHWKNLTAPEGPDPALDEVGWYQHNAGKRTHPVGGKTPNAWGLFDCHGNA